MQILAEGVVYALGPVRPTHSAPNVNYHLLGWWSTDRPLPVHHVRRRWVCNGGRAYSALLHPPALATDNGRTPHYQRVPRGGCCLGGGRQSRVLGSEPLCLRTHRLCGRSRPLRNAVVVYQAPSVAVWLQLCAKTGHASEHSRHSVMHGSPPAHRIPRPCLRISSKLTWFTSSVGATTLWI